MKSLGASELAQLLLAVSLLLATAQLCAVAARRIGQPAVLGELFAGILLGPTVFGRIAPGLSLALFPHEGGQAAAFHALTVISVVLFQMAVAGLEVDLGRLLARFRVASAVGVAGIVVPFAFGFLAAYLWPHALGADGSAKPGVFAFYIGLFGSYNRFDKTDVVLFPSLSALPEWETPLPAPRTIPHE